MDGVRLTYRAKLFDPRWQRMRLLVFARDNWSCIECGDRSHTLHVHHLSYAPRKDPWETNPNKLATLCQSCHQLVSPAAMASLLAKNKTNTEDLEAAAIQVENALTEWVQRRQTAARATPNISVARHKRFVSNSPNWRKLRPRAGRVWTPDEDAALLLGFDAGLPLEQVAFLRGRGVFGVAVRLLKLGRKLPSEEIV